MRPACAQRHAATTFNCPLSFLVIGTWQHVLVAHQTADSCFYEANLYSVLHACNADVALPKDINHRAFGIWPRRLGRYLNSPSGIFPFSAYATARHLKPIFPSCSRIWSIFFGSSCRSGRRTIGLESLPISQRAHFMRWCASLEGSPKL